MLLLLFVCYISFLLTQRYNDYLYLANAETPINIEKLKKTIPQKVKIRRALKPTEIKGLQGFC